MEYRNFFLKLECDIYGREYYPNGGVMPFEKEDFANLISIKDKEGDYKNVWNWKIAKDDYSSVIEGLASKLKLCSYNQTIYFWDNLIWTELPYESFADSIRIIYRAFNQKVTKNKIQEIFNLLHNAYYLDKEDLNNNEFIIPLRNGYLNINGEHPVLEEPYPDYYFTYYFDIKFQTFEEKGEKLLFQLFFEELIPDQKMRNLVGSFIVECMTTSLRSQKFVLIIGRPRTGKTVLTTVLTKMFDGLNGNIKLQDLTKKHASASLENKLINIGSDLSDEEIREATKLKDLITDRYIDIRPLYKPHTTIKNLTRHFYTGNFCPIISSDGDDALYRRAIMAETCDFINTVEPNLTNIFIAEIDKVFNYLIQTFGTKKLMDEMVNYCEAYYNRKLWFKLGNSVFRFVYDKCCMCDLDVQIDVRVLYDEYKNYCKKENYRPKDPIWFSRILAKIGVETVREYDHNAKRTVRKIEGLQVVSETGICFKNGRSCLI